MRNHIKLFLRCQTVMILLLSFFSVSFAAEEQFDFRKVRWGMTLEEIIKAEGGPPASVDDDTLSYNGALMGTPCTIHYALKDGKLFEAGYYRFKGEAEIAPALQAELAKKYNAVPAKDWPVLFDTQRYENERTFVALASMDNIPISLVLREINAHREHLEKYKEVIEELTRNLKNFSPLLEQEQESIPEGTQR